MNINRMKALCLGSLGCLAVASAVSAQNFTSNPTIPEYPGGSFGTPITTGGELIATGGDVSVTYL